MNTPKPKNYSSRLLKKQNDLTDFKLNEKDIILEDKNNEDEKKKKEKEKEKENEDKDKDEDEIKKEIKLSSCRKLNRYHFNKLYSN